MKTTSKTLQKKWAIDEGNISLDEVKRGIKKAEQGPFYTAEEAKKLLKRWRARKGAQLRLSIEFIQDLDDIFLKLLERFRRRSTRKIFSTWLNHFTCRGICFPNADTSARSREAIGG